jgi:hypothetical protein
MPASAPTGEKVSVPKRAKKAQREEEAVAAVMESF